MNEKELIEDFKNCGALLEGHFILSSGLHSTKYLQCALALSNPILAKKITKALGEKIIKEFNKKIDYVIAPAMGGLIIGHEIAMFLNLPFMFLERVNGEFELRRGFSFEKNSNFLMIEDVVTTGLSSMEAIKVVNDMGGNVIGEAAIIDRSGGEVDIGIDLVTLLSLNIPTFILNGEKDNWVDPECGRQINNLISSSTIKEFEGVSHWAFLEQPNEYANEIINFLCSA